MLEAQTELTGTREVSVGDQTRTLVNLRHRVIPGCKIVKCRSGWQAVLSVTVKWVVCHRQQKLYPLWSPGTEAKVLCCGNFLGQGSSWMTG
jgi:hypothetical protein